MKCKGAIDFGHLVCIRFVPKEMKFYVWVGLVPLFHHLAEARIDDVARDEVIAMTRDVQHLFTQQWGYYGEMLLITVGHLSKRKRQLMCCSPTSGACECQHEPARSSVVMGKAILGMHEHVLMSNAYLKNA